MAKIHCFHPASIYCSFSDGDIYVLQDNSDLKTLMDEQAGYNGVLISVSKGLFEMVEYVDGEESGFTTRVKPKTSEPLSVIMFDMDKAANKLLEHFSTVMGEKC